MQLQKVHEEYLYDQREVIQLEGDLYCYNSLYKHEGHIIKKKNAKYICIAGCPFLKEIRKHTYLLIFTKQTQEG